MRSLQLLGELSISRLNPAIFMLMPELRSFEPNRIFLAEKRWIQISGRLNKLFPDIAGQWKHKKPTREKPNQGIWVNLDSENRGRKICLILSGAGIDVSFARVKAKEIYGIQIPVADFGLPTILEKLTSLTPDLLGDTSIDGAAGATAASGAAASAVAAGGAAASAVAAGGAAGARGAASKAD
jgi:hypothetical protein